MLAASQISVAAWRILSFCLELGRENFPENLERYTEGCSMTLTRDSRALTLLKPYNQFVVFGVAPRVGKPGKLDKFPIEHNGARMTGWQTPSRWISWDGAARSLALESAEQRGVGIVIAPPLHFLDIDNCIIDGTWSPGAIELIQMFPGAYCEISMSGTGAHVIFRGDIPRHGTRQSWHRLGLELYDEKRFCALTGNCIEDHGNDTLPDHSEAGAALATLFPSKAEEVSVPDVVGPRVAPRGSDDDDELIRNACDRDL
jgi:hypothetical protein